jgi:ankyrin repeat protein
MKNRFTHNLLFTLLFATQISINTFGMEKRICCCHNINYIRSELLAFVKPPTQLSLELFLDKLDEINTNYVNDTHRRKECNSPLYREERATLLLYVQNWIKNNTHPEEIDLNSKSKQGNTLLRHAIDAATDEAKGREKKKSDMFNFTQYLLEHNVNPNIQNNDGKSAFFHCMWNCLPRSYEKHLISHENRLYKELMENYPGVGKATEPIKNNDAKSETLDSLLRLFLAHNADPNIASQDGEFICALAEREYSETVKQIIALTDIKACMNNKNRDGNTPSCCAAMMLNLEFLQVLANAGADFSIKNLQNKTPLDYALEGKDDSIGRICGAECADAVINFLQDVTQTNNQ